MYPKANSRSTKTPEQNQSLTLVRIHKASTGKVILKMMADLVFVDTTKARQAAQIEITTDYNSGNPVVYYLSMTGVCVSALINAA